MNLQEMSIAVRERSMSELYDLAVLVLRRHACDLFVLSLVMGLPLTALNWWLLGGGRAIGGSDWYWLAVLLSAEAPLYAAVITNYLGQAMFSQRPGKRRALAQVAARWPGLLGCALLRGLLTLFPPLLLLYPAHLVEVLVLERLRGGAAWRRAWSLASFYRSEDMLHLLVNVVLSLVLVVLLIGGACELVAVLQLGLDQTIDRTWLLHPSQPWVIGACFLALTFCTTLRFCSYLDLRTKREGWEVELALRAAGQRLEEVQP